VRPAGWRLRRPDVVLSAIAALGVLLVHDLAYVLHHPYWLDEAWVVDSTRVRLSDLTHASAITPLGFTVLLRGAVLGGDQRQRLVPLAFAGATVSAAYLCGRQVGLPRSVSFLLLALPVLFVPALLVRDDLKQYTAEALWSVLVLLLMLRLESVWSRRRLGALTLAVGVGPLFANAALFVGSAGLLALGVTSLCRRRWGRLREVVLAGVCALLVVGPLLVLLVLPQQNAALKHYWDSYYLPTDPASAWSFLVGHLQAFAPTTGLPNVVVVLLGCTTGIAMLVRRGRSASALLVPLAFAELVLAGALHVYPLLDLRTSTWLAVLAAVLIGLGVGEVLQSLAGRFQQAAVGLAALAGLGYCLTNTSHVRAHLLPNEDVRSQTRYVQAHLHPGDVVIVDLPARYGYGYYAGTSPLPIVDSADSAAGFLVRFDRPQVVAMQTRNRAEPGRALQEAATRLGPQGRVFIVRTHFSATEQAGWRQALANKPAATLHVGAEPLLVLPAHALEP